MAYFVGTALKVQADVGQLIRFGISLKDIEKQIKFAKLKTVNNLAYKLRLEHQKYMKTVFHRPLPYTLRGIEYYKAKPGDEEPKAELGFVTNGFSGGVPAGKYLQAQAFGGTRVKKSTERQLQLLSITGSTGTYTVPSRKERNSYGNMPGGRYTKILSQLKISKVADQNATESDQSQKKRRAESFFILKTAKYNAIFSRTSKTTIKPALYLKRTSSNYKARYPFYDFSTKYWDQNIEKEFDNQWAYALATARW